MKPLFNWKFAENVVDFLEKLARAKIAKFKKETTRNETTCKKAKIIFEEAGNICRPPDAVVVENCLKACVLKIIKRLWLDAGLREKKSGNKVWDKYAQEEYRFEDEYN